MSMSGTRESATADSRPTSGRHRGTRRRRVLGRLGSALLMLVMAVAILLPGGFEHVGRSLSNLFSGSTPVSQEPPVSAPVHEDPPASTPEEPADPLTTREAMQQLSAAAPVFGVYTPGSPHDRAELAAAEAAAGTDAGIVAYFADASHSLDVSLLDAAAADGAIPMVSLETTSWSTDDIAAGRYDDEIRRHAQRLAELDDGEGGVVLLRLNHEMNGHWYSWSESEHGNQPGDYAASWKRFVDVVRETGTGNTTVLWVWSPNILRGAELDAMIAAYPGDDYVDYIGLTGYGNSTYERTAGQTFDLTIRAIRDHISADKPLIITESGASTGKYQTSWTRSLGPWLEARDDVHAFVWFDSSPANGASADWRFTTSPQIAEALREALAEAGATPLTATR